MKSPVPALQVVHDFATSATGRHDAPHGTLDVIGVVLAAIIVVGVIVLSMRYLVRPGEHDSEHIKRRILDRSGSRGTNTQAGDPRT